MRRLLLVLVVLLLACLTLPPALAQEAEPVAPGEPLALAADLPAGVRDAVLAPGGQLVYALLDDGTLAVLSNQSGRLAHVDGSPFPLGGPGYTPTALALAPDGTRLYIANQGTLEGSALTPITVFTLDPATGYPAWLGDMGIPAQDQAITALTVSDDGTQLVVGGFIDSPLAIFPAPFQENAPDTEEALTESFGPEMAQEWINLLYERVQADAINAPQAARIYGYGGVTLYEALVPGMPLNLSLAGQLNGFPDLPIPNADQVFDWPAVGAAAMRAVLQGLMSEESAAAFTALHDRQVAERRAATGDDAMIDASLGLGDSIGADILAWAQDDGFDVTRELTAAFEWPTGDPALWVPTTEGRRPVEPYWGSLRPFALSYADACAEPRTAPYSEDPHSAFYQQALEVKTVGDALTPEQIAITEWWIDTPGVTGAPAGHWMRIGGEVIEQLDLNLAQAAEIYGMLGMTLADTFISTWSLKYQDNLLRPVTYIQRFIDPRWQPYVESPSFPEYPSGHSVTSAAAADMLTSLYGAVAFTDHTHDDVAEARSYTSFEAAATEAAFSRMYGGIHYRQAIENGLRQGRCVTENILDRVTMRRFGQNE